MLKCQDVANYFLTLINDDCGERLTHLKLQKLVYYAQGVYLAVYDEPLFNEPIEAWAHGPVVPQLYAAYKKYKDGPLPLPVDVDFSIYSEDVKEILDEVHCVYGQFSAWKLRDLTHEESPWKNAYKKDKPVISLESMKSFFKLMVIENGTLQETV